MRHILRHFINAKVNVMVPGGNCGDELIYCGADRLCIEQGISAVKERQPVLFVYGCGGYCEYHHSMLSRLPEELKDRDEVIIFPSSFDITFPPVRQFLHDLPKTVIICCRERYSYAAVSARHRNAYLEEDTAFACDLSEYASREPEKKTLYAFRDDRESRWHLDDLLPENNDVAHTEQKLSDYLGTIADHKVVCTDRAHVAIAAAQMGREVRLWENAYHKVRGIYEYSLERMPNVCFVH